MAIHESSVSMMVLIFDLNLIWEQRNSETYLKPFFKRSITFSNRIEAKDRDARELTDYLHRMEQEYQTRGDG